MRIGKSRTAALNYSDRSFVSLLHLVVNHKSIVMLNAQKQFFGFLVDRDAEGAVGSMKLSVGGYIADSLARENNQAVHSIIVDCINVAGDWIDIESALEFDLCIQAPNDALGVGYGRRGRV